MAKNANAETNETNNNVVDMKIKEKAEKKPNVFKRVFGAIKTGFRKVRESPVAAAIGAVGGAAITMGTIAYLGRRNSGDSDPIDIDDDLIEIEDSGEDYAGDLTEEEVEEE